ncbi:MAG: calcium/sodium antiporter [Bacilli bacterium]|nr:calcium/sodium antiporter [Bacilli bacterium]
MDILFLIIGLIVIVKGSDFLVDGCVGLAKYLKIPTLVIGLTIVAIATGVPEIAISISSSLKGSNDLLLGNLLGSNMFNILFILGLIALIKPLLVKREIILKNYIFALLSCFVLFVISYDVYFEDSLINIITRTEGILFLCFSGIFLYSTILGVMDENRLKVERGKFHLKDIFFIILGIIMVGLSAEVIVQSAINISMWLGISESIIGLTVIAVGTNLPELVTSIVAVKKGEVDMAIGNLVGTNIYNIFLILGLAAVINPITISSFAFIDMIILAITSFLVYLFIQHKKDINKIEGIIMIGLYLIYLIYVVIR